MTPLVGDRSPAPGRRTPARKSARALLPPDGTGMLRHLAIHSFNRRSVPTEIERRKLKGSQWLPPRYRPLPRYRPPSRANWSASDPAAGFRSGIDIEDYQLDPVVRAIRMPRINLLIADGRPTEARSGLKSHHEWKAKSGG